MSNNLYVIDVMPLLYRGHFAFLSNPRITSGGVNTSAITSFVTTILQIIETRAPSHIVLVLDSATPTFRHAAFPQYKANREKIPEDIAAAIPMAVEFAKAMRIDCIGIDGYEADDLMGSFAAAAKKENFTTYLVTGDKDIAQLVDENTFLYRIGKKEPEIMSPEKVCSHWQIQRPAQMVDLLALAGDSSDNIPGIRGVGEKTAQSLIARYDNINNLFAHTEELTGKLAEKVREGIENAKMSHFLATIKTEIPLPCKIEELAIKPPDKGALAAFCAKYELAATARRIFGANKDKTDTAGMELFAAAGVATLKKPARQTKDRSAQDDISPPAIRFKTLEDWPHIYECVTDTEGLAKLVLTLKASERFAFDTETDGPDPFKCRLAGISFAIAPGKAWYVHFPKEIAGQNAVREMLAPILADPHKLKIGHNVRFDCVTLARHQMPVAGVCHDTMLTHFVLDSAARHGLDRLAREELEYQPIPISQLIGEGRNADPSKISSLSPEEICDYAAEDADVTLRLYDVLRPRAREYGLVWVLEESEEPLSIVLAEMQQEGVNVNPASLKVLGEELSKELSALETQIYEAAGTQFNINSPKQLGETIFGLMKIDPNATRLAASGQYSTSEDVLSRLKGRHKIIDLILDYRAAAKLKSTYADKLPECIDSNTGRIHSHFSQSLTETGRLSSFNPNLQNIPVRTERGKRIREAFIPRDERHLLLSADYSQIELRVMAALSKDEVMLEAFRNGADIHTETAARVYNIMPQLVSQEMRSRCKMVNFGIIYGISAFGLSQRLNISRRDAADLISTYFEQYQGIKAYTAKAIESVREKGYAETILGRRRFIRDIASRNATVRQAAERNAVNTPVQGSAADLIKLAMVKVSRALKEAGLRTKLILQIHDELLFDMPVEEEDAVREIVRNAMVNALDLGVPLEVEIGVGKTWLQALS